MKQHKLFWGSSYDRGLDILLYFWTDIKKTYPDAELHICYGWKLFDQMAKTNPERRNWKSSVVALMDQPGVIHHGRVGKEKLAEIRQSCGIWAYPTYFTEINCITALDCMKDGVVPVTMDLAALKETVGAGILVDGDIKEPKVQKEYLEKLLNVMGHKKRWRRLSIDGKKYAKQYKWANIAKEWVKGFEEQISTPLVSVITPTIRSGWWNIMAHNLSIQTYKNFEWIIVDDYPEERPEVAKKYAKLYNLKVRYLRGDKCSGYSRRCGLVRANNIGWQNAKGELLVWLQDFILMPKDGIESLVNLHRHHPNDLIAPVDVYYHAKEANRKNEEDWWDGETQIITEKGWTNTRVKNEGISYSENPFDYESNYGAIPMKILKKLNGWWEFFDDGLGFDNTEIAVRALMSGSKIVLDDTNIAKCINIWPEVKGTAENILDRDRILNPPRFEWFMRQMEKGKIPVVRNKKIDDSIHLPFKVPKMDDKIVGKWIDDNALEIMKQWKDYK